MSWIDKIFGTNINPILRNVIIGVVFLGVAFGLYRLGKYLFVTLPDRKKFKDTVNNAENEIKNLLATQQPTYSDSTYSGWANQIQRLVEGCDFDTNTTDLLAIFSNLKNDLDYLKLVKAFDVRDIDECGFTWITGSYNADLPTVFRKETMTGIAEVINSYFAKRGIKSRI